MEALRTLSSEGFKKRGWQDASPVRTASKKEGYASQIVPMKTKGILDERDLKPCIYSGTKVGSCSKRSQIRYRSIATPSTLSQPRWPPRLLLVTMFHPSFQSSTLGFEYPALAYYGTTEQNHQSRHDLSFMIPNDSNHTDYSQYVLRSGGANCETERKGFAKAEQPGQLTLQGRAIWSQHLSDAGLVEYGDGDSLVSPFNDQPPTLPEMDAKGRDSFMDLVSHSFEPKTSEAFRAKATPLMPYPGHELFPSYLPQHELLMKVDNFPSEPFTSCSPDGDKHLEAKSPFLQRPPQSHASSTHAPLLKTDPNGLEEGQITSYASSHYEPAGGSTARQSQQPNRENCDVLDAYMADLRGEYTVYPGLGSFEAAPSSSDKHYVASEVFVKVDHASPARDHYSHPVREFDMLPGVNGAYGDKVDEFDYASLFSGVSTVACFGYNESAENMVAFGMIHVLATGPRSFDVTLQRYLDGNPEGTSTSLRGVDIPRECNSLDSVHELLELRFIDLFGFPEYYGFSCVMRAYAQHQERSYERIVAEVCKCLYEALTCA